MAPAAFKFSRALLAAVKRLPAQGLVPGLAARPGFAPAALAEWLTCPSCGQGMQAGLLLRDGARFAMVLCRGCRFAAQTSILPDGD